MAELQRTIEEQRQQIEDLQNSQMIQMKANLSPEQPQNEYNAIFGR